MGLNLEVGKKYTDRTGNVRGPMRLIKDPAWHKFTDGKLSWGEHGEALSTGTEFDNDLIALWQDAPTGPVRTVTRKEIVPGVYGGLEVGQSVNGMVFLAMPIANFGREQIETLIDNLGTVRDALEDGQ